MATTPTLALHMTSSHGFNEIRRAVRHGDIQRLRHGAYVPPLPPDLAWWQVEGAMLMARCRAVRRTLTSPFVFAHETAAFLYEWPGPLARLVHIAQTFRPGTGMSADIVRHYWPEIPEDEIVYIDGLPVAGRERTVIDCALAYDPSVALPIVDAALRTMAQMKRSRREESIARQEEIRPLLIERLERRGPVRNIRRARAVLEYASGFAESRPESWIRWVGLVRGLPVPILQQPVLTVNGILYPDEMWPGHGPVMVEYDGMDKYDDAGEAVTAQTDREQTLIETVGGTVVRFTKHDKMNDPDAAFRRLIRAFPPGVELTPRRELQDPRVRW